MAVKAKDLATSQLMTYQQLIGMANEQMDDFATRMQEFLKEEKVGKNFYDKIVRELQPKVEANNKILSDIERELFDRVQKSFPDATLPNVMGRFIKKYQEEIVAQSKAAVVAADAQTKDGSAPVKKLKPKLNLEE
jgi:hypothetical protein